MTAKWNYQHLTPQQRERMAEMLPQCGGQAPLAELLIRRGVDSPEGA